MGLHKLQEILEERLKNLSEEHGILLENDAVQDFLNGIVRRRVERVMEETFSKLSMKEILMLAAISSDGADVIDLDQMRSNKKRR